MKGINILLGIVLLTSILLTTIVYSAFNTQLNIEGEAIVRSEQNIRITNISISNTSNGAYETYNSKYNKDVTYMYVTLPAYSSISYDVEITNKNDYINDISKLSQESHTNPNVNISISLQTSDTVEANSKKTFTITLTNNTESEQQETLVYQYGFMKHISFLEEYSSPREYVLNVPYTGIYKLETWGAQGGKGSWGSSKFNRIGGYGGYSSGFIYLNKGDVLYINVGGQGNSMYDVGSIAGGYNGGGSGYYERVDENSGSGGGATHIAIKSGLLSNLKSSVDDILIVAGGGGGGATCGAGSLVSMTDISVGGSGGGYLGTSNMSNTASGGTQNDSGSIISQSLLVPGTYITTPINHLYSVGSFGQGGNDIGYQSQKCGSTAGGGGGFYGGVASNYSGTGGSGYIGNSSLTNKAMYCYNCQASNEESTKTISTTCVSESPTANCAKIGNGATRISLVKKNI